MVKPYPPTGRAGGAIPRVKVRYLQDFGHHRQGDTNDVPVESAQDLVAEGIAEMVPKQRGTS
ncbi:MAG: hypothetical protein AAGF71_04100 [Pseudomonadota bacterium]